MSQGPTSPAPAAKPADLRILHLEDMASDAELVEKQLRRSGMRFVLERADTRNGFIQALAQFHPDVVLADFYVSHCQEKKQFS